MCTSVFTLALAAFISTSVRTPDSTWMDDYSAALARGRLEGKPLAVFVASGPSGYEKLTREGPLSQAIRQTLARHYVCVYLDGDSTSAKPLIQALQIRNQGVVISDLSGGFQAYHHSGSVSQADLANRLEEFATSTAPVYTTVSTSSNQVRSQAIAPISSTRNC